MRSYLVDSITRRRALAALMLASAAVLTLLLTLPTPASDASGAGTSPRAPEGEDWQGRWSTSGIHGEIRLDQDGDKVRGKYIGADGKIKGTAEGKTLTGHYECDGEGKFEIHFVHGTRHQEFKGEYKPEGKKWKDWKGERL